MLLKDIKEQNPDVIILTEVTGTCHDLLEKGLSSTYHISKTHKMNSGQHWGVIGLRKSIFIKVTFHYKEFSTVTKNAKQTKGTFNRIMLKVQLQCLLSMEREWEIY